MPTTAAPAADTLRFADQLERAYRGGPWHGPGLAEILAGVDAATAHRHPIPGAHSIAELVGHVAFWIDQARLRAEGTPSRNLADGDDWRPFPGASEEERWQAALAALERAHTGLHATVAALGDDGALDREVAGSDPTLRGMLLGILQHTAYHAGQITLLRKAAAESAR